MYKTERKINFNENSCFFNANGFTLHCTASGNRSKTLENWAVPGEKLMSSLSSLCPQVGLKNCFGAQNRNMSMQEFGLFNFGFVCLQRPEPEFLVILECQGALHGIFSHQQKKSFK